MVQQEERTARDREESNPGPDESQRGIRKLYDKKNLLGKLITLGPVF